MAGNALGLRTADCRMYIDCKGAWVIKRRSCACGCEASSEARCTSNSRHEAKASCLLACLCSQQHLQLCTARRAETLCSWAMWRVCDYGSCPELPYCTPGRWVNIRKG